MSTAKATRFYPGLDIVLLKEVVAVYPSSFWPREKKEMGDHFVQCKCYITQQRSNSSSVQRSHENTDEGPSTGLNAVAESVRNFSMFLALSLPS